MHSNDMSPVILNEIDQEIVKHIKNNYPIGQGEIWQRFFKERRLQPTITARFSKILNRGVIKVFGRGKCPFTKRMVYKYVPTGLDPVHVDEQGRKSVTCGQCNGSGRVPHEN